MQKGTYFWIFRERLRAGARIFAERRAVLKSFPNKKYCIRRFPRTYPKRCTRRSRRNFLQSGKIAAYLGFCIRSGKISFGIDQIGERKKDVYLILADDTLSENSFKNALEMQTKFSCPLIVTSGGRLGELIQRPQVKAVGIR